MWKDWRVAVVVPAFCEVRLLPRTLEQMPEYVDLVVVVDDGSPDETFAVARRWGRVDERVKVVRLGYNYGVGRAISAGYERALREGVDVVAVMAADAQMDPDDLPALLSPVVEGRVDYAKGNRLAHEDARRMPVVRRIGTWLLGRATGLVAGELSLTDSQCGYTAISAKMLERLALDQLYPRYGYPNDLLLRLAEEGARISQPVVRPVYGDEVSGLKITGVVGPISGILARGVGRRLGRGTKKIAAKAMS